MLKSTGSSGYHITFANGYTASVQWGSGNYCDNYNAPYGSNPTSSATAEVAYWKDGPMLEIPEAGDTVNGHLSANEVLAFLTFVSSL